MFNLNNPSESMEKARKIMVDVIPEAIENAGSLSDLCLLLRKIPDFAGNSVEKCLNSAAIRAFSPWIPALPDDFLVTKPSVRQTARQSMRQIQEREMSIAQELEKKLFEPSELHGK
ncbi:MAG: hypothetical protein PHH77_08295 [Victivallaceae bacterium]|nr:hypothetical protein [Victivallaceae bacterium]